MKSVKDQQVPVMRPMPSTSLAGMYEATMPSVTPCVSAMCTPTNAAPISMPARTGRTLDPGQLSSWAC